MQNHHGTMLRVAPTLAMGLLVVACATPDPPSSLVKARLAYSDLAADPGVVEHAPVELYEAEQALDRAEDAWGSEGDEAETDHRAYVADRRIAIARVVAEEAMADEKASRLGEQRTQVLLDAREAALLEREREVQALKALNAKPTQRGAVITLGDVLFEFGGTELKPGAVRELQRLVAFLHGFPDRTVAIEGHTDSVGTDSFNVALSHRRARAVKSMLVSGGVEASRITTNGFGEAYPVASNDTDSGRQRNRRVDLVIQSPDIPAKRQP